MQEEDVSHVNLFMQGIFHQALFSVNSLYVPDGMFSSFSMTLLRDDLQSRNERVEESAIDLLAKLTISCREMFALFFLHLELNSIVKVLKAPKSAPFRKWLTHFLSRTRIKHERRFVAPPANDCVLNRTPIAR
jgi:hypothetical protein